MRNSEQVGTVPGISAPEKSAQPKPSSTFRFFVKQEFFLTVAGTPHLRAMTSQAPIVILPRLQFGPPKSSTYFYGNIEVVISF